MKFGLLYSLQTSPKWNRVTPADVYSAVPKQAQRAEELGFESIFFTEHHLSEHAECPSPLIMEAAVAARTERVQIGSGVLLAPFYHPVKLAEDIAVLDNLSNGRVILGIGLGYRPHEFAGFGIDFHRRVAYYTEVIEVVARCLREEGFDHDGTFYHLQNVRVMPRPVQHPVPIWIGALRRKALERVAQWGYTMPIAVAPLPLAKKQRTMYREALEANGRSIDDFELPVIREAFCGPTDEQAWETAKPYLLHLYQEDYLPHGVVPFVDDDGTYTFTSDPNHPMFQGDARGLRKDRVIIGSPETFIAELERHMAEVPCDHWIFRVHMAGMPPETAMQSIELIAREVIPYFKSKDRAASGKPVVEVR